MEDTLYWIGFNFLKGIGAVRFQRLLDRFGSAKCAWEADPFALAEAGLSVKVIERLAALRKQVNLPEIYEKIQAKGIKILTWQDEAYPKRLREISQPPPVLYYRGELFPEDTWAVAVVGTRRVTPYGRQVAEDTASFLAANGVTIVSGLARGVDGIAHRAALRVGGRTLAVLGSGVDQIYPPEHLTLAEQISEHGAVLSDYPPETAPESANFPPRNRIISGLSMAVIVIEAGETSGALITAEFAAEQGRDVFAVPGNILAPQSKGTNKLILQGASPLLNAGDVMQALNLTRIGEHKAARKVIPGDDIEAKVLNALGDQPLHVDEIRSQTSLPIEKVTATLVMMELKGMVRQVGGMQYVAVREVQSEYLTNDE